MDYLEKNILEWHRDVFPNATLLAKTNKLTEECRELIESINGGDIQHALEEAADIFIVAVSIAGDRRYFDDNVNMCRIITDKMAINKGRDWGEELPNGDRKMVR